MLQFFPNRQFQTTTGTPPFSIVIPRTPTQTKKGPMHSSDTHCRNWFPSLLKISNAPSKTIICLYKPKKFNWKTKPGISHEPRGQMKQNICQHHDPKKTILFFIICNALSNQLFMHIFNEIAANSIRDAWMNQQLLLNPQVTHCSNPSGLNNYKFILH